jgi:hypothetical protein
MRLRWAIVAVVLVLAGGALYVQQRARMERERLAARETALRDTLTVMRKAIASFHDDNGRYPGTLEELVPKYLHQIPTDPMGTPWRLTTEETVAVSDDFQVERRALSPPESDGGLRARRSTSVVIDVHSSAPGYGEY